MWDDCVHPSGSTRQCRERENGSVSWDVFAMRLPAAFEVIEDIPVNYDLEPIGTRAAVLAILQDHLPMGRMNEWGSFVINGPGYSMDIDVGSRDDDIAEVLTFQVWGSGEEVVAVISSVLDLLGLRGIETGSGGFFDPAMALGGWKEVGVRVGVGLT